MHNKIIQRALERESTTRTLLAFQTFSGQFPLNCRNALALLSTIRLGPIHSSRLGLK